MSNKILIEAPFMKKVKLNVDDYSVSASALDVMTYGKILAQNEAPYQMLQRVINAILSPEENFGTSAKRIQQLADELIADINENRFIFGSPLLTNAGKKNSYALSSCVVIPVDLNKKTESLEVIKQYYKQNMGSGFDLSPYEDPINTLLWIENVSKEATATGLYERYIGNMGSLDVRHPKIIDFISAKAKNSIKHFNISVVVNDEFMHAAQLDEQFTLSDGKVINAQTVLKEISENAWLNGDPGVLFLDRMNADNPVEEAYKYVCTPPCAEMGLSKGETCQFGYINVSRFVILTASGFKIDYSQLERVVKLAVRLLDNAIEISLASYPTQASIDVARYKRKMGIGVCGLADLFLKIGVPYSSIQAKDLARDIISFINYVSKLESVNLASYRGSCDAMFDKLRNKYYSRFLELKYGLQPTNTVKSEDWKSLNEAIVKTGFLRNILTTALPPSGRSALLLEASTSIEPIFSIYNSENEINANVISFIKANVEDPVLANNILEEAKLDGSFQNLKGLSSEFKSVLKTAKELTPREHLDMLRVLAGKDGVVDEAASKTVNLKTEASEKDVRSIFTYAYKSGLKNISVYRDGSHLNQPYLL